MQWAPLGWSDRRTHSLLRLETKIARDEERKQKQLNTQQLVAIDDDDHGHGVSCNFLMTVSYYIFDIFVK